MLAVSIQFTAGRFSATPWGKHANEGMVEWPPSQWRLLRALVAVWRRTMPEAPQAEVTALLHRLASAPRYRLPLAREGHTRHYMPVIEGGQETRSLIFDAFVVVPREAPVVVEWPDVNLGDGERALLGALLERLPHFGRAESWCHAWLTRPGDALPPYVCSPLRSEDRDPPAGDYELVSSLVADAETTPAALLADLEVDTGMLRQRRRDTARPPGARWQLYARPSGVLSALSGGDVGPAPALPSAVARGNAVARYAVIGPVRPQALYTVDVADAMRRAVMKLDGVRAAKAGQKRPSVRFSGKDEGGRPLHGHCHAFYLPVDDDGDGFIEYINVCLAPALPGNRGDVASLCFTADETRTLEEVTTLWGVGEAPLSLVLVHLGPLDRALNLGDGLATGRVWQSATPYMVPKHPKAASGGRGWRADGPEEQLRAELAERFGDTVATGTQISWLPMYERGGHTASWQAFRRWRANRGTPPPYRPVLGARLAMPEPVTGPIALGYGCHFGLGQFRAQPERR